MKFSAAVVLVLSSLVIFGAFRLFSDDRLASESGPDYAELSEIMQLRDALTIDNQSQSTLRDLQQNVAMLEELSSYPARPVGDLIAVRPTPAVDPDPVIQPAAQIRQVSSPAPSPGATDYTLSMVFIGPGSRFAVVNGMFREEGDRMPGGGTLLRVMEDRVIIRNFGEQLTVHMQ
ncbi:MAG TPA: hypothetical protein DEG76_07815 [Pseudohongiella sp.]|nr:hypothetical protein [Pseudohongiella sp.]HBX37179.1 hypothetical protein [Pseudohongiella sp.]|tara:strand:- start:16156 stop:16680 length:525 start_codon:yes stop_codon:yes gene_type:complete